MPTNLNALIRYKRIDSCLKNPYVACTILRLQEICTEALGEFRGRYGLVSERTIRDDIKVLRSEILGFNAPIEVQDGVYFYSDKAYSIFKTPITEVNLLKDILKMLLEERNNIADLEIDKLLLRIAIIIEEPIPLDTLKDINEKKKPKPVKSDIEDTQVDTRNIRASLGEPAVQRSPYFKEYIEAYRGINLKRDKSSSILLLWDEILAIA